MPGEAGSLNPEQMMAANQNAPKKRRECYVGNLAKDEVTTMVLWRAISNLFQTLPAFQQHYPDVPDPVVNVAFPSNSKGMFAFVEFHDEVIANTAILMSGFELCGRAAKVGRPQSWVPAPYGELPALDVEPLRQGGLLPAVPDHVATIGMRSVATNKLRELYIGNLLQGAVTEEIMMELLTPVASQIPEFVPANGPPVQKVNIAAPGHYCFATFQNPELASRMIAIFDETELFGRKLRVRRPTGFQHYEEQFALKDAPALPALPPPPASQTPPPPPPPQAEPQPESAEPTEAWLAGAAAIASLGL